MPRSPMRLHLAVFAFLALPCPTLFAEDGLNGLFPLMNVPEKLVYENSFDNDGPLDKSTWQARQGTRWKVVGGVFRGEQSSPEYQAKKADHKGFDPRVRSLKTPQDFIAEVKFRFIGGDETKLLPIIEFGHHNVRLKFSRDGVKILADHESVQLAETTDVKLESEHWYHILAERSGDEFVVQFVRGPTLLAKHKSIAIAVADEKDGMSIAGTRKGIVEIDHVKLWTTQPAKAKSWPQRTKALVRQKPAQLKQKK